MKRIFIDGGTHLCEGLRKVIEIGVIDLNTEIHTFEPNPSCNVIERIKEFKNYNITYYDSAIWILDGVVKFNQENIELSKSGSPNDGQSITDGWASSVDNIGFIWKGYEEPISVKSIDFSKFIESLDESSHIICKFKKLQLALLRKKIILTHRKKLKRDYLNSLRDALIKNTA